MRLGSPACAGHARRFLAYPPVQNDRLLAHFVGVYNGANIRRETPLAKVVALRYRKRTFPLSRQLIAVRLDRDILQWLQGFGPVYCTRINNIPARRHGQRQFFQALGLEAIRAAKLPLHSSGPPG